MQQEIKYKGVTANPDEYNSQDGDLSLAIGLINEDGGLRPIMRPCDIIHLANGEKVRVMHNTSLYKHYICYNENNGNIFYIDKDRLTVGQIAASLEDVKSFNTIGNTLLAFTDTDTHYYLWTEGAYKYLGSHLPELALSFGLQATVEKTDDFDITFDKINKVDTDRSNGCNPAEIHLFEGFSDKNKTDITRQVLAKVNKFIAEKSTKKGRFLFPFFVRYAYRLYDSSLVMHSAPILMLASSDITPVAFVKGISSEGDDWWVKAKVFVAGACHQLDYCALTQDEITDLQAWKDIVRSVDVFISKPIYTYDQSGECESFEYVLEKDERDAYCVCKHLNLDSHFSETDYPTRYRYRTLANLVSCSFILEDGVAEAIYMPTRVKLPRKSAEAVAGEIRDCAQFYLLESIELDNLKTARTVFNVSEDYLEALVNREAMTDDYDSHDTVIPSYTFAYNSRINYANIKKRLFEGYNTGAMFSYSEGITYQGPVAVTFAIKQDGKDIYVSGGVSGYGLDNLRLPYIFYPNINAYKAYVRVADYFQTKVYEFPLTPHPTLNGAYYWHGFGALPTTYGTTWPNLSTDRTVRQPNKIYTSEVNNPFYFPTGGINTVGTGEIRGIASAAKALSQGQFGQFPLYAFATDGVWALEVSTQGTYSAKQPVTREVLINSDALLQLDTSVLFATDRGLMLIGGSEVVSISDDNFTNIKSDFFASYPKADKLRELYMNLGDKEEQEDMSGVALVSFKDYIATCRMAYDYTHQRVIIYTPQAKYAYVFSLKTKTWGMMLERYESTINDYPNTYLFTRDNYLRDLCYSTQEKSTVFLVTRAFKLGDGDIFKTIDTIIQRGTIEKGQIGQALYASNDLRNWQLVWSSKDIYMRGFRGTPYKYFRLAVIGKMSDGDCLSGFTAQFTPRRLNQPR